MKKTLLFLAAAMTLASCGVSKFFSSSADAIGEMALVEPYAYVTDAIGDWATDYLDGPSRINRELVADIVTGAGLPVATVVPMEYGAADPASGLSRWMRHLSEVMPAAARDLDVPEPLMDAIRESGYRYGLLIADIGFVKNAREYNAEKALETGTKVLDFLFNNSVDLTNDTDAYANGIFSVIVDSQDGDVVWYGSCPRNNKRHPLERASLENQLSRLFKAFR